MEQLVFNLTLLAALGSGLIAGLFFAFSTFVMTALGDLPPAGGIAAMQSINRAILNPLFFAVFFGTAVACLVLIIVALLRWSQADSAFLAAGGLLYLLGNIFVTMVFNVPLNKKLAASDPTSSDGASLWRRYLSVWTGWNHVRTIACLAAMTMFMLALS